MIRREDLERVGMRIGEELATQEGRRDLDAASWEKWDAEHRGKGKSQVATPAKAKGVSRSTAKRAPGTVLTAKQFQDRTALLPHVISDAVGRPPGVDRAALDRFVTQKALDEYHSNPTFRRKADSKTNAGRDYLYSVMPKWHQEFMIKHYA